MKFSQNSVENVSYLSVDSWRSVFHGFVGRGVDVVSEKEKFTQAFGDLPLLLLTQVHGRDFIELSGNEVFDINNEPEADAWLLKDAAKVSGSYALGIKSADCGCILVKDSEKDTVAAIHSGWKSTKLDILGAVIERMFELGSDAESIQVAVGPHARVESYEVGLDIVDEFKGIEQSSVGKAMSEGIFRREGEKYFLNISECLRAQALSRGVLRENILVSEICTIQSDEFFSHRREKEHAGRQVTFIGDNSV